MRFAREHAQIGFLLTLILVMTLMVFHVALMPVIATDLLDAGASGYALLITATGVGAIGGALLAGEFVTDRRRRIAIAGSLFVDRVHVRGHRDVALAGPHLRRAGRSTASRSSPRRP